MVTHGTLLDNRRTEPRHHYSDVQLTWRKGLGGRWRRSYLHDLSHSGLSMLVFSNGNISPGQDIELIRRGHQKRVLCRIVRTDHWDEETMLIGARILDGRESLGWIHPSPDNMKASRSLARQRKAIPRSQVRMG